LIRFVRHLCVPVLLVLGVACAMVVVQPHAEVATVDLVEIVEDVEADAEVVVTASIEPRSPHSIPTSSLASPHGSPATRPAVPPPRP